MSHKKKLHPLLHKPFTGSVELLPPQPLLVEFIDAHRLWGFPIQSLERFVLEENPQRQDNSAAPPEQLVLIYPDARVLLRGWRLELMLRPLVSGRVARVHAEKYLGSLILEDAWVSEIQVVPRNHDQQLAGQTETPALVKQP
jgi:hypothetical protein